MFSLILDDKGLFRVDCASLYLHLAGYELSLLHILVYTRCILLKVFANLLSKICHCDIILL